MNSLIQRNQFLQFDKIGPRRGAYFITTTEICKDEDAITLCFDCHSYFCEACFKYIHDKKKEQKS